MKKNKRSLSTNKKSRRKPKLKAILIKATLLLLPFLLIFGLGRKIFAWFNRNRWDGKSQINLAIEADDIVILSITPKKNIISLILIPSDLEVETPWFGTYQAGKLPLLIEQEGSVNAFTRSLAYFFGFPVDGALLDNVSLEIDLTNREELKGKLRKLFFPPPSLRYWQIWQCLRDRDLVWKVIDLSVFSQEKSLPDGSLVLTIDPRVIENNFGGFLTDPLVKQEDIPITILNLGETIGLAKKMARVVTNMGGRVIEVGDSDLKEKGECSLVISQDLKDSFTVRRLESAFGCEKKLSEEEKGIRLLIRDVKIQ